MNADAAVDAPFDKLQWIGRALVITGPDDDPALEPQLQALEAAFEGLKSRDIVTFHFYNQKVRVLEELSAFPFDVPHMYTRGRHQSDHLRLLQGLLKTDDDIFSVVLVGLDGTTKRVWSAPQDTVPVSPQEIFKLIDAMPLSMKSGDHK